MNKISKMIILIVSMIIIVQPVFAICSANCSTQCCICTSEFSEISLIQNDCNNTDCDFNLFAPAGQYTIPNFDLNFTKSDNCDNLKINLNIVDINLSFTRSSFIGNQAQRVYVSGIDTVTLINSNLVVLSKAELKRELIFDLTNIDVIFKNNSSIFLDEEIKNGCASSLVDQTSYGLGLEFKNIEISNDSNSFIKVQSAKSANDCLTANIGNPASITGNTITNYSNDFNLIMISGDSANGRTTGYNGNLSGGDAIRGGKTVINLENYFNYGNSLIFGKAGFGGNGGQGEDSPNSNDAPGNGGNGGKGGSIYFTLNNIYNLNSDANLIIDLNAGDAGNGGRTGFDSGGNNQGNYAEGGNGGHGGDIKSFVTGEGVIDLNLIYNTGNFNFNAFAGNGGNGGAKFNHACGQSDAQGIDGNAGNGGYVFDLNVNTIYNDSNNFNFNLVSGEKGNLANPIFGATYPCNLHGIDGIEGITKNIYFNNFTNTTSDGMNIFSQNGSNSTNDMFLKIGYLRPGSYLPKSISLVDRNYDSPDFNYSINSSIFINGCFAGANSLAEYKYITKNIDLSLMNLNDVILNIDYSKVDNIDYSVPSTLNCNYCDYNEFGSRIDDVYSLYSNLPGNILARDLNIYYSKEGVIKGLINSFYPDYPVYTNKNSITGVFDSKYRMYKYTVYPENLIWYDSPDYNLKLYPGSDPLCQGQEYFITGDVNGTIPFQFSFVPTFKRFM